MIRALHHLSNLLRREGLYRVIETRPWEDLTIAYRKGIEDGWKVARDVGLDGPWPPWDPSEGPDLVQLEDYRYGFLMGKEMFTSWDVRTQESQWEEKEKELKARRRIALTRRR